MMNSYLFEKDKSLKTDLTRAELFAALGNKESLLWVDLDLPNEFESDALVEIFNFHPLAVEDCLIDISQPKVDDYDEYLFLVVHALPQINGAGHAGPEAELTPVELDIFFGKNYVVTFHKQSGRSVAQVREAVLKKPERFMGHGADMLVHAILDRIVDNYQPLLDQYDHKIDQLEDEIFNNPPADFLAVVMRMKQNVYNLRRIISPQRDLMNYLARDINPYIRQKHLMYFRDIYDHLFRIYGIVEGFHESLSSLLQAYFSYSSYKLNDVVKHLTAVATLAMPPVIVASIYGMNFRHMPELEWTYGYPFAIGMAFFTSIVLLVWMKFKKWI